MTISITATLLSAADPAPVQVVLTGMTSGQTYTISGTSTDGTSWDIPGGSGTSDGSQVAVIDNRSALNVDVTYVAVVDGTTYSATAVTVTWSGTGQGVIQTLDGLTVVGVNIASLTEPRKGKPRIGVYDVAGREFPAIRLDIAGSSTFTWQFDTSDGDSTTMKSILKLGVPIVRRLPTGIRDLPTSTLGVVTDFKDVLFTDGTDTLRRWTLTVREIEDPEPSAVLSAYTWDDFDTAMADYVWSYYEDFTGGVSGYTATNGSLSQQTSGGYYAADFARLTASAATPSMLEDTSGNDASSGQEWTVSARVKGTAGLSVTVSIYWDGAGTTDGGTPVTLTTDWQQASVTATAPASTTGIRVKVSATGASTSDTVDVDAITVANSAIVPTGAFDELFATWDEFDTADWASY